MRLTVTAFALAVMCSPAAAQTCYFFNQTGQFIDYRPDDGVVLFHPAYDESVHKCRVLGYSGEGDSYNLMCEQGPVTLTLGASTPELKIPNILVFGGVFYWLKCTETI